MRSVLCALLLWGQAIVLAHAGNHLVVIDPGHGGSQNAGTQAERSLSAANNATSPSGLKEKDLTLELALRVRAEIEALAAAHPGTKLECRLLRTEDVNLDFIKRAELCASARPLPSAIVSIHFNASGGGKALGSLAVVHHPKANPNHAADLAFAAGLIKRDQRRSRQIRPRLAAAGADHGRPSPRRRGVEFLSPTRPTPGARHGAEMLFGSGVHRPRRRGRKAPATAPDHVSGHRPRHRGIFLRAVQITNRRAPVTAQFPPGSLSAAPGETRGHTPLSPRGCRGSRRCRCRSSCG